MVVVCAATVVAIDAPQPLRAIGAGGLALWAPGFALSIAAFPAGAIGSVERGLLAIATSLAVTVVAAIALDAVGVHVGEVSLLLAGAAVTCGATAFALQRHPPPAVDSAPRLRWRVQGIPIATAIGMAIVLAAAVVVARITPQPTGITGASALAATNVNSRSIEVKVTSAELTTTIYRLTLRANGRSLEFARFTLPPGGSRRQQLARPLGSDAVEIFLYRGIGRRHYRRVVVPRPPG